MRTPIQKEYRIFNYLYFLDIWYTEMWWPFLLLLFEILYHLPSKNRKGSQIQLSTFLNKMNEIIWFQPNRLSAVISQILMSLDDIPENMWIIYWSADSAHLHFSEQILLPSDWFSLVTSQTPYWVLTSFHPERDLSMNTVSLSSSHVVDVSIETETVISDRVQLAMDTKFIMARNSPCV